MPYAIFTTNRKQWYDGYGVTNRSSRARIFNNYDDAIVELDRIDLGTSFAVHEVALCRANGCNRIALAKGFCNTHYGQMYRGEDMHLPRDLVYAKDKKLVKDDSKRSSAEAEKDGLIRELAMAEENYNSVVGMADRLKWRATIRSLEARLIALEKPEVTND